MIAKVMIPWDDIDAPLSQHTVSHEGDEQQCLMEFLLREGNMLAIAQSKVRRWYGKPLPKRQLTVHKSSIHTSTAVFCSQGVHLTFKLLSSEDDIIKAKWTSTKDCPKYGDWISPDNTGFPVRVMGFYVDRGRRNVIYAFRTPTVVGNLDGVQYPRLTIGTVFGRDWT